MTSDLYQECLELEKKGKDLNAYRDKISSDIKHVESVLKVLNPPEHVMAIDAKKYISWKNNRLRFYTRKSGNRPLIEQPFVVREEAHPHLLNFVKELKKIIGNYV